jgi:hypothetical protein
VRQILLALAVIWFLIQALPSDAAIADGRASFELLQRLSIGLALLSAALMPWPPLRRFDDVDVQVKGDRPESH